MHAKDRAHLYIFLQREKRLLHSIGSIMEHPADKAELLQTQRMIHKLRTNQKTYQTIPTN